MLRRAPLCARRLLAQLVLAWMGGGALLGGAAGTLGCAVETGGRRVAGGKAADVSATGGGSGTIGGISLAENPSCPDASDSALESQRVDAMRPVHRVLYSWTALEQETELRAGGPLLSVGEVPGKGKGIAMDLLTDAAEQNPESLAAAVAEIFGTFRYAWPNPWATRLGFGGEDYGDRLIRMELREDAWIGILSGNGRIEQVYDLDGRDVPLDEALAAPERIAALYFIRDNLSGGPFCGTFAGGSGGYREFILGNAAMIERWSLGTQEIVDRIDEDIAALTEYFRLIRPCPPMTFDGFNAHVVCSWGRTADPYLEALALPGDEYVPTVENLVHLIETLESDRFEPDPYVVEQH